MKIRLWILIGIFAVASGCAVDQHFISNPGKSQFIKVESGDDWHFKLNEPRGQRWHWHCDDHDVSLDLNRNYEKETVWVNIHVHRGYDGPSAIYFELRDQREGKTLQAFNLGLFKRTGDEAFWK